MANLLRGAALAAVSAIVLMYLAWRPASPVMIHRAAVFDVSPPLGSLRDLNTDTSAECDGDCGNSPGDADEQAAAPASSARALGAAMEQTSAGNRPPAVMVASFDGLGVGFEGPQGPSTGRNPSDNSLAVGPNHVVQIVNSRMAVFDKKGTVQYGAVTTNTIFKGFGGICEIRNNGDAVVRYDQLAERWLFVMPIFGKIPDRPEEPYSMCYAVSTGADPLGPYHRYEFRRKLFPDYPRPAVWPDGYYNPTSTGDTVIQKHACVADRAKMLRGEDATEQCVIIDGVNFLNNADLDGRELPPAGAPNIMMAAGGTQLHSQFEDDGIYAWKFHVDWNAPKNTAVSGPVKIPVAPYHYLCDGQLTNCVPQPDTTRRLDAQGDKIMQRLVYRRTEGHESLVALHSVNTAAGAGGVRWYEFRIDEKRDPRLYQQGTYAPDAFYRWMGSPGMDRQGNIGIGYSFGGTPNFPGQRFAARLAGDPLGKLSLQETILVKGEASQTTVSRWEDYATTAMDPDDCTFWYVGDYVKAGAATYSTRIGAFRLPGCLRGTVSGTTYFDLNHNNRRDPGEPGLAGREVNYAGGRSGKLTTDAQGKFSASLPADPAYFDPIYKFSAIDSIAQTIPLKAGSAVTGVDIASVCVVQNRGGAGPSFWLKGGKTLGRAHHPDWPAVIESVVPGASIRNQGQLSAWFRKADAPSSQLVAAALNVAYGTQDGNATIHDPLEGDWPSIRILLTRASAALAGHTDRVAAYGKLLEELNDNIAMVTPSDPAKCGPS